MRKRGKRGKSPRSKNAARVERSRSVGLFPRAKRGGIRG